MAICCSGNDAPPNYCWVDFSKQARMGSAAQARNLRVSSTLQNMDRNAEKNRKRRRARKIVTDRLRRYYDELCVICANADEILRRAMQRISGRRS